MRTLRCFGSVLVGFSVTAGLLMLSCSGPGDSGAQGDAKALAAKRALWSPVGLTGGGAMYMT